MRDDELLDWALMLRAFRDACEEALDWAADIARYYPEEVAAVERVRKFARARAAGRPAHLRVDDLLFTFTLILAALEKARRVPPSHADHSDIVAASVLRAA